MKAGGRLTVERMVKLGRVSRSGFYRFDDAQPEPDPDMDLRDAIQKIALEWPCYGRPRITKELRERGWKVNPKRVYRLMREDNLLCVRKRRFVVTTDSNHGSAQSQPHRNQHVAQGQSVGQRGLRVVHENAQVRRSAPQRIPGLGRDSRVDPRVSGKDLQQKAPAFRARLHATGPLRTISKGCRCAAAFCMSFPRHREIYRPKRSSCALVGGD